MIEFSENEKLSIRTHLEKTNNEVYRKDWYNALLTETNDELFRLINEYSLVCGSVLVLPGTINSERLYFLDVDSLRSQVGVLIVSVKTMFSMPASITKLDEQLSDGTIKCIAGEELQKLVE